MFNRKIKNVGCGAHHKTPEERCQSPAPKSGKTHNKGQEKTCPGRQRHPDYQSIVANPLAFNLKQENQNRIQENYERKESSIKFDSNRKTVQRGVGPSHETPAAASAGLQPARLARNGNRAFTRRVETISIGLKPMRLVLSRFYTTNTFRETVGAGEMATASRTFEAAARATSACR